MVIDQENIDKWTNSFIIITVYIFLQTSHTDQTEKAITIVGKCTHST